MADSDKTKFPEIGQRLADMRGVRTQADISRQVGTSTKSWGMYERGERLPSPKLLATLRGAAGFDLNFLFTGERPRIESEAVLDLEALTDAIETALLSAEAVREKGKTHTPQQIAAHARALYEIAIRERVDRIVSPTVKSVTDKAEAAANDTRGENGDQALHRKRGSGK